MKSLVALLALAGCYRSSTPAGTTISNQARDVAQVGSIWIMSERGLGPLDQSAKATESALGTAMPGTRVAKTDLGGGSGIVFEVFERGEKLMYVVPDDVSGDAPEGADRYATTIFAIFATSSRVQVEGRTWRAGSVLTDARGLSFCECWGDGEVTACFAPGAHVRVIFEERCEAARKAGGQAMVGKKIGRLMWKAVLDPAPP